MIPDDTYIGRQIQHALIDAGMKPADLQEPTGLGRHALRRIITGKTEAKVSHLRAIAEATGKPLAFFVS